jgi:hypothetical protein
VSIDHVHEYGTVDQIKRGFQKLPGLPLGLSNDGTQLRCYPPWPGQYEARSILGCESKLGRSSKQAIQKEGAIGSEGQSIRRDENWDVTFPERPNSGTYVASPAALALPA